MRKPGTNLAVDIASGFDISAFRRVFKAHARTLNPDYASVFKSVDGKPTAM